MSRSNTSHAASRVFLGGLLIFGVGCRQEGPKLPAAVVSADHGGVQSADAGSGNPPQNDATQTLKSDAGQAASRPSKAAEKGVSKAQPGAVAAPRPPVATTLKTADDFEAITDAKQRSVALFAEVGKVLIHPRCVNCHPAGDRPRQGDTGNPHQPLVVRGPDGHGAPAMQCQTCHGEDSYLRMPGAPNWHLAPASMAWEGRSMGAICEQLKDTKRNGGLSLAGLHEHMVKDPLVGYGWKPPQHLRPVPGTRAQFGALVKAWIDSGAHCPKP